MARTSASPRSPARPRTPQHLANIATPQQSPKTSPASTKSPRSPRSPLPSGSPTSKSPRNPANKFWTQEMQRRKFLEHLHKWSLSHDSSPHFHGTIRLSETQSSSSGNFQLGKSVNCVLADKAWIDASKRIVIRLFAPRKGNGMYKLVVRNGAGWVTAREYLCQEYTSNRRSLRYVPSNVPWHHLEKHDTVIIRPLFQPFTRLPLELQHLIFGLAIGKREFYQPARSQVPGFSSWTEGRLPVVPALIPLCTVFLISKTLSQHLIPWIYRTTDFYFGTTGLTNFLWHSGPTNRPYINKLTLAFGRMAMLHCARWLAPDPIFALFNPPMATSPPALQYLWRCQIQDMSKDLHLSVLTIDLRNIPVADVPFVVHTLSQSFGSVEKIRITNGGYELHENDAQIAGLKKRQTWAELCKHAFERYKMDAWYFDSRVRKMSVDALHWEMKDQSAFFDRMSDERLAIGV